jgi:hypothetical protein
MSIGNLKDSGNQGNNFPWQYKVLLGLQGIIDSNNNCCEALLPLLQSQLRIPYVEVTTTFGESAQGIFYSISIANIGAAAGLVNDVSIPAGTILNFDAGTLNNVLDAISWDATDTTFLITGLTGPTV